MAQIEIGGDARVNPDDFEVTTFAEGLNYPVGMALLPDGALLVAVSNGANFLEARVELLYGSTIPTTMEWRMSPHILADNVPGGALTTVRIAGELVFTTGQGRPISVYRSGDTPTAPLTYLGDITITYSGAWLHPHSTLAARPTPGVEGSIDLYFQLGSSENFALTTRMLDVNSSFGYTGSLVGDAIHYVRILDDGTNVTIDEITPIATGLRNATGLDFHPESGDLYISENGIDGLMDPNEPHSADELNVLPARDLGTALLDFGFPTTFEAYRTGEQIGATGVLPLVSFQPLPDPMTGAESEGPNDIAFSHPDFRTA